MNSKQFLFVWISVFLVNCITCTITKGQSIYLDKGSREKSIDLNGTWEFRLDSAGIGEQQAWFGKQVIFTDRIKVPGAWQAQGFGKPSGNLQHQYTGLAWYRREVTVPETWKGKRVLLKIGGAHRRTTLFVNNQPIGMHDGFSTPFSFEISKALQAGKKNVIALRIDNMAAAIEESPDKQQGILPTGMLNYIASWGGVYGNVTMLATDPAYIKTVGITTEWEKKTVTFRIEVAKQDASHRDPTNITIQLPGLKPVKASLNAASQLEWTTDIKVELPHAALWSPENPQLQTATITLQQGGKTIDQVEERFGLREVTTQGKNILLNGKPLYLRGYGDDNIEVLTGFPSASKEVYLQRFRLAKSYGFNAVRYHSMIPPSQCFEAADEVGMLIMAELPAAYIQYFFQHRDFQRRELNNALLAHRNHPSLFSMAFGNEFFMFWLKDDKERERMQASVTEFYKEAKKLAPGTLVLSNDGVDLRPTDLISVFHHAADDLPTIRHEFGDYYCSLPDVGLIDQFNGVMTPDWLKEKKKWVQASGLENNYPQYLKNSRQLLQEGRKFQLERVRADKEVTGYHYWLIVDFPGGTGEGDSWEEGWFDFFWKPKDITPEQGQTLNNPVLLMIDAGVGNRSFWNKHRKPLRVTMSNYGTDDIKNGVLTWSLFDGKKAIASDTINGIQAPMGTVTEIANLSLQSPPADGAKKLSLVLTLLAGQQRTTNHWDFWSYPEQPFAKIATPVVATLQREQLYKNYPWFSRDKKALTPTSLLITDELNQYAVQHLEQGGKVLLLVGQAPGRPGIPFFPLGGGANGTVLQPHPALKGFTGSSYLDLQFYNLANGAHPVALDNWPGERPALIGGIRTTSEFLAKVKKLSHYALAFEGKVGKGSLFVSALRILDIYDEAFPEVVTFLNNILVYMGSPAFQPGNMIPRETIERYYTE